MTYRLETTARFDKYTKRMLKAWIEKTSCRAVTQDNMGKGFLLIVVANGDIELETIGSFAK